MLRAVLTVALAAATTALPAAATAPDSLVLPRLQAKVSAAAIALTDSQGLRVRELQHNTYRIVVADTAKTQNFRLTGPGVNRRTGVAARDSATWTVRLSPGIYVYRSDRNKKLRGSFIVKKGPPPA